VSGYSISDDSYLRTGVFLNMFLLYHA
jgi:hypothetical protein